MHMTLQLLGSLILTPHTPLWGNRRRMHMFQVPAQLNLGKPAECSSGLFHNQLSMTSVETQETKTPFPPAPFHIVT